MLTTDVQARQSWPDLTVQLYGNVDALVQMLGDSVSDDTSVVVGGAVAVASVQVRESDPLANTTALRALDGAVIATITNGEYDPEDYGTEDYDA